jgi:iron complex transport system ATP-binding protein
MAYVPQAGARALPFTVGDFVMMGRFAHHGLLGATQPQDHIALKNALQETGLLPLKDRPMNQLSGGERQKAFLAAALAQGSPLLLLDEPTTFLDYRHQVGISKLLRDFVQKKGQSILLVTHDLNAAARVAHRILGLVDGQVLFEGTPTEFLTPEVLERIFGTPFLLFQGPKGRLFGEPAFQ